MVSNNLLAGLKLPATSRMSLLGRKELSQTPSSGAFRGGPRRSQDQGNRKMLAGSLRQSRVAASRPAIASI